MKHNYLMKGMLVRKPTRLPEGIANLSAQYLKSQVSRGSSHSSSATILMYPFSRNPYVLRNNC